MLRKLIFVLLPMVALAGIAIVYASTRPSAGARQVEPFESTLFADGNRWCFEFTMPPDLTKEHFIGMQIRRSIKQDSSSAVQKDDWVSLSVADEILVTAGIGTQGVSKSGIAAVQVLDLRDNRDQSEAVDCFQFAGGIQVEGSLSRLKQSASFFRGNSMGVSVNNRTEWRNNETCLMTIETQSGEIKYRYDVMLEVRNEPISH